MKMQANPITVPAEQPPIPIKVCKVCGKKLLSNNRNGYCRKHRGRLYRPKGKSKIIVRYKEGHSLPEVAALCGVSITEVKRVINEEGLMRSKAEGMQLAKRGRSPDAAALWKRVELNIIERKSIQEIAKQLKLTPEAINASFHRMSFPATSCHSFGEVVDRDALRRLNEMSDLGVPWLAQKLRMPAGKLEGLLSTQRPGQELEFDSARKIVDWREGLFFGLLAEGARHSGYGRHSRQSIILKFFPHLGQRYRFLMQVLPLLAKKLRDNPKWDAHKLQQDLCEQAMRETSEEKAGGSPGNLFRSFLPWAPCLMPFLAGKLQELRGVDRHRRVHHEELAWELIARSLHTKAPVISQLDAPSRVRRTKQISQQEMRELILKRDAADRAGDQQQQQTELEAREAKLAEAEAEVERRRNQPRTEASKPKAPGQESIGNNRQSKRARERSQLTRAVTRAYIEQPEAKGLWVSQFVDEQGVLATPTMEKNGLRSFEAAWRDPRVKHNLEATYSRIHRKMERDGTL